MNKRYDELDSLRGLAALTVLLAHILSIFKTSSLTNFIQYGPTRIFVSGSEAVNLFFILSGFVLSLPFFRNSYRGYVSFAIKRICRIYFPYALSIVAAVLLCAMFYSGEISNLSDEFNVPWSGHHDWNLVIQHFIFFGNFNYSEYNGVMWSLIHEMRISLVFPFLMIVVLKYTWRGILVMYVALIGMSAILHHFQLLPDTINSSIFYSSLFVIGAMVAKYRNEIIKKLSEVSTLKSAALLLVGVVSYLFIKPSFVINHFLGMEAFYRTETDSIFIVFGGSLIIVSALTNKKFNDILLIRPIHFFGKMSYSFYLFHGIIILALLHWLYQSFSLWLTLPLAFVVTFAISLISYKFVELPSIKLGKRITTSKGIQLLYHRTMRNIHKREGNWQTNSFQYHHDKLKQYK